MHRGRGVAGEEDQWILRRPVAGKYAQIFYDLFPLGLLAADVSLLAAFATT